MIILDFRDRRPIYEQIVEKLQELMMLKVLESDEKLPSVRSVAADLSINPNTVQRAYAELERQGYIYSVKGKGSFVADIGKLVDVRREDVRKQLNEAARQARISGISREEFLLDAKGAYEKGGNMNDRGNQSDKEI
ncbi:GntR family transcriptional regulator [Clostridium sp. AM58-1XD]|uniref:GntR family transcriptional regulator n=1 Tax=Clostridium sp. AM58-1XD TaxID=2292307 RepID=UPI000E4B731E|nr:GntR family transcriptional regulator [Clostridium sp. AM58-1XD]RGY99471.1 GntR family transcriptional regulator [Clostridium sp. AM58-1XD]